ncbi:Uu.00g141770.m01.CDS01 [Anthostomella pinea]|uniref:Uu.00g141770.m01.CDS01 n=1 Tax=Anthostomella pinea TaxID=933095 RepID=A0AAI8YJ41_9PEZI|nr:Uu.00g141770.m01.CDS01 [Anthostomella pinea]
MNLNNGHNKELESFFVDVLGVSTLDASIVYNELMDLAAGEPTVKEVKELLWTLNSELVSPAVDSSPMDLLQRAVLPVRDASGKRLENYFGARINLLDFMTNEIIQLGPLIKWVKLEQYYLLRLVKETTVVDADVKWPASEPNQDIRTKAYGLFRVATHFKSPRLNTNHSHPRDGGTTITEEIAIDDLHTEDDTDGFKIYVPHDERLRDASYHSTLPKALVRWLLSGSSSRSLEDPDSGAIAAVQGIISAKNYSVERILDNMGIIEVDIPNQDPVVEAIPGALSLYTAMPGGSFSSKPRAPVSKAESGTEDDIPGQETRVSPSQLTAPTVILQEHEAREYRALLSQVFLAARRAQHFDEDDLHSSDFPFASSGGQVHETRVFFEDHLFGAGLARIERDQRVGAAGELFSSPLCEGFSRDNRRSTIREFASHPDYADMTGWAGFETSDMEYLDSDGALTMALIRKGYLPSFWEQRKPHYYIEVKTTPGNRDTPFFMSQIQYEKLASEGSLSFTADRWMDGETHEVTYIWSNGTFAHVIIDKGGDAVAGIPGDDLGGSNLSDSVPQLATKKAADSVDFPVFTPERVATEPGDHAGLHLIILLNIVPQGPSQWPRSKCQQSDTTSLSEASAPYG